MLFNVIELYKSERTPQAQTKSSHVPLSLSCLPKDRRKKEREAVAGDRAGGVGQ